MNKKVDKSLEKQQVTVKEVAKIVEQVPSYKGPLDIKQATDLPIDSIEMYRHSECHSSIGRRRFEPVSGSELYGVRHSFFVTDNAHAARPHS